MCPAQTADASGPPDQATPGDSAIVPRPTKPKRPYHRTGPTPDRGKRYSVLEGGDYRVFRVAAPGDEEPPGTLCAIPGIGGFERANDAFIEIQKSGTHADGRFPLERKLLIVRVHRIVTLTSVPMPKVQLEEEPRRTLPAREPRPPDRKIRPNEAERLAEIGRQKAAYDAAHTPGSTTPPLPFPQTQSG